MLPIEVNLVLEQTSMKYKALVMIQRAKYRATKNLLFTFRCACEYLESSEDVCYCLAVRVVTMDSQMPGRDQLHDLRKHRRNYPRGSNPDRIAE